MNFLSRFLPKKDKPVEIKNNIPKEKENIKKTFAVYCHSHHGTDGAKLCAKCNGLLLTVMTPSQFATVATAPVLETHPPRNFCR